LDYSDILLAARQVRSVRRSSSCSYSSLTVLRLKRTGTCFWRLRATVLPVMSRQLEKSWVLLLVAWLSSHFSSKISQQ